MSPKCNSVQLGASKPPPASEEESDAYFAEFCAMVEYEKNYTNYLKIPKRDLNLEFRLVCSALETWSRDYMNAIQQNNCGPLITTSAIEYPSVRGEALLDKFKYNLKTVADNIVTIEAKGTHMERRRDALLNGKKDLFDQLGCFLGPFINKNYSINSIGSHTLTATDSKELLTRFLVDSIILGRPRYVGATELIGSVGEIDRERRELQRQYTANQTEKAVLYKKEKGIEDHIQKLEITLSNFNLQKRNYEKMREREQEAQRRPISPNDLKNSASRQNRTQTVTTAQGANSRIETSARTAPVHN